MSDPPLPVTEAFARYWTAPHPFEPAWADLPNGSIAPYPAEAGTRAIAQILLKSRELGSPARGPAAIPQVSSAPDYYSSALIVLSRVAASQSRTVL